MIRPRTRYIHRQFEPVIWCKLRRIFRNFARPYDTRKQHDILVIVFARMRITDGKGWGGGGDWRNEQRQRIRLGAAYASPRRALSPLICLPPATPRATTLHTRNCITVILLTIRYSVLRVLARSPLLRLSRCYETVSRLNARRARYTTTGFHQCIPFRELDSATRKPTAAKVSGTECFAVLPGKKGLLIQNLRGINVFCASRFRVGSCWCN